MALCTKVRGHWRSVFLSLPESHTLLLPIALHKRTAQVVAIKQVIVKDDKDELMKEIEYMQGCQNDHIVRFYGSYLKNDVLWVSVHIYWICCFWSLPHLLLRL